MINMINKLTNLDIDKEMGYYTLCKQLTSYQVSKVYSSSSGSMMIIGINLYKTRRKQHWDKEFRDNHTYWWSEYADPDLVYKIIFDDGKKVLKDATIDYSNYIQEALNRNQTENIVPEPNKTTFENIQELINYIKEKDER